MVNVVGVAPCGAARGTAVVDRVPGVVSRGLEGQDGQDGQDGGMPLTGEYVPSPSDWVRKQVETIMATGTTESVDIQGRPVVLMTMLGAKSGKVRKVPVMRVEHDGRYLAVASKGGHEDHPVWYANVIASPVVTLQDGTEEWDVQVRELDGDERQVWWDRAVDAFPNYADYQRKTDRLIPVLLLEPASD